MKSSAPTRSDATDVVMRVRNLLAIVRSVFERTTATGTSLEEVARHFTGRLDALARRQSWAAVGGGRVELEDVIRDELLPLRVAEGPRLAIAGPPVPLTLREAELIGLAIHELATNSVKFGALGGDGAVRIEWNLADGSPQTVELRWTETGVAVVTAAPIRTGFGREFIEQALPYQLHAQTQFRLKPGGVCCTIVFPLASLI